MIGLKRSLSRRTLLKGGGAAIALPLLDAMLPAMSAVASTPAAPDRVRRLSYVYMPMGFNPTEWTPVRPARGEAALDKLPSSLHSLEAVKEHVTVITGMEVRTPYPGSHAACNSAFLSTSHTQRCNFRLGPTVDQIAARHIGQQTRLPSLQLAMDQLNIIGQCDNGYAYADQSALSWASPTLPLPSEAQPRVIFERLFGDAGARVLRPAPFLTQRASLLDSIVEETSRLRLRLGAADRNRVDEYLSCIREVERRIQRGEVNAPRNVLPDLDRPVGAPVDYADHARLMFDLQALAFQGDITRITTFQLAREASTRAYPEIGVPEPHHTITHHGNNAEKLAQVAKVNRFHVSLFAGFLEKLASIPEGEGTLLDHSLLMFGSGMGDGDAHDHTNLPVLLAGGGAGQLRGGRHVVFDKPTPMADLHRTVLNNVGLPDEAIAESGRLAELSHNHTV